MYRGSRDPMLGIIVPQTCCNSFMDHAGKEWVEIFIPPNDMRYMAAPWPSIMVPTQQVYYIDDEYNEFYINAGAVLNLIYKSVDPKTGKRFGTGMDKEVAERILGRFLQYEYFKQHGIPNGTVDMVDELYNNYMASGLKMFMYIKNRI